MTRRFVIAALAAGLLVGAAPAAGAVNLVRPTGAIACAGHSDYGGYCVDNPVPDVVDTVRDATR